MNDIYITLTGNVAAEPRQYSFDDGARVTSLRVLTTHRYFDKKTGQWADGERVCFAVRCWRALGDNVAKSVQVGQPVVVSGKLRIREFGPEGDRRFMPEVEANSVGHDLRWGTGVFAKPERGGGTGSVSREMRDRLDEETQDWALGAKPAPDHRTTTRVDARVTEGSAPRVTEEQQRGPGRPAETLALANEVMASGKHTASQQDRPTSPPSTSGESGMVEEGRAPTHSIKDQISASVLGTGSRRPRALESTTTADATKQNGPTATKQPSARQSASSPTTSPTGDSSTDSAPTDAASTGAAPRGAASTRSQPRGAQFPAARPGGGATVRILGADDNETEAEDAGWPTEERAAA